MRGSIRPRPDRGPDTFELRADLGRTPSPAGAARSPAPTGAPAAPPRPRSPRWSPTPNDRRHRTTEATFGWLLDRWLDHAELSPTTVRGYRSYIDRRLAPALGQVRLRDLTALHLDELYQRLGAEGLARATVRQCHSIVRRALGQALKWGYVDRNVATMASPPALSRDETVVPDAPVVAAIVEAAETDDEAWGLLVRTAAVTGMRRAELCGLRWGDVDLETAVATVRSTVVAGDGELVTKAPKTRQVRRFALDNVTVARLGLLRLAAVEVFAAAELDGQVDDLYVWSPGDGTRPWHPDSVSHKFKRTCRAVGAPEVKLHELRHWSVTAALDAGIPVPTVSSRVGHSSSAVTLGTYAHRVEESDRQAAALIARQLPT